MPLSNFIELHDLLVWSRKIWTVQRMSTKRAQSLRTQGAACATNLCPILNSVEIWKTVDRRGLNLRPGSPRRAEQVQAKGEI